MGKIPIERVTPDFVFQTHEIWICQKTNYYTFCVCLFVSLSVKAVHLEIVSDLTPQCFIAAFRRFTTQEPHKKWRLFIVVYAIESRVAFR